MSRTRADLVHPLPLAAVAVMLVNDHLLKGAHVAPAIVTGKLSDVAGLFFFPILLATVAERVTSLPRRRTAWLATASTGLVFVLLKTSPWMAALASGVMGDVTCDPTDLFALPALAASLVFLERAVIAEAPPRWARGFGVMVAALASVATSRPMQVRNFPTWETTSPERDLGCAWATTHVGKSGKEGFGLVVRVEARRTCEVRVVAATADIGGERVTATDLPTSGPLTSSEPVFLWIPFPFDNERAWNDGRRTGSAELVLRIGDREDRWPLPLNERYDGPHERAPWTRSSPPAPVLERAGDGR